MIDMQQNSRALSANLHTTFDFIFAISFHFCLTGQLVGGYSSSILVAQNIKNEHMGIVVILVGICTG